MTFRDLMALSLQNLFRRKLRTFLTVLGVFIGTTSIVVMMSLGIGLNQFMVDSISRSGSLTMVTVSNYNTDTTQKGVEEQFLTDEKVAGFRALDHVTDAYPVLSYYVIMKQGLYQGNIELTGMPARALKKVPLSSGSAPEVNASDTGLLVGNMVGTMFYNARDQQNMDFMVEGTSPVDFMKPVFTIFDTDAFYASQNPAEGTEKTPAPKKYILPVSGMIGGKEGEWNEYSYSVLCDLESLTQRLRKIYGKRQIPGQPVNRKGKPYRYMIYNTARIEVDDMDNVMAVQKELQDMGYEASSNMEWLKQSQSTSQMIQAVLGGIGAVSLLVAAIGITNTMMMSIYERTKEIGIMKVLGCDLRDIRNMFLMEAGCIGFLGGTAGLLFSFTLSAVMNRLLASFFFGDEGMGKISVIPLWLAAAAVAFAVLVGMASGFFPARRAMHLSPLAAIRNE
jgi:ABC-type antimicrobial peptide transport system permease subunit